MIGEMREYNGFVDYLKLKKEQEKQDLILIKAKSDFLKEEDRDYLGFEEES